MCNSCRYDVFVRNWWRENPKWPDGLEPHAGARKTYLARNVTREAAYDMCQQYNKTHKPGRLSRKAEFQHT